MTTDTRANHAGEELLAVQSLHLRYPDGHEVLRGIDMSVQAGELVVILGANGSGKSTLLRCICRLLTPTGGKILVDGHDLAPLNGDALRVRRLPLAMIFQHANLVKRRSVIANVVSGSLGRNRTWRTALGFLPKHEIEPAFGHLRAVGLEHLAGQRAGTLSGGQAQRVAVARALAQNPKVLLADEPLASLDPEAAEEVMRLLKALAKSQNLAIICVLHQPELACRYVDRLVGFLRGVIAFDAAPAMISPETINNLYDVHAPAPLSEVPLAEVAATEVKVA